MAKKRYISDSIWTDIWFEDLKPNEKLLFLYILTNPLISICWIYEISIKRISYDTWINKLDIINMFTKFEEDKKIYFKDWIVVIINFVKNQNITSENDKLWKWIEREVKENGSNKLNNILPYKDLISTLQGAYKDLDIPYLTLLNLTLPNSTLLEEEVKTSPDTDITDLVINNIDKNTFEYIICSKFLDYHLEDNTPSIISLVKDKWRDTLISKWCDVIRKLKELDDFSEKQISFIIDYTLNDDFWKYQILSIEKFRKKKDWVTYFVKMIDNAKSKAKNNITITKETWTL